MISITTYLDADDADVIASGSVEWGDEGYHSIYSDEPPQRTQVVDLLVERDGVDVTDELTPRERARIEGSIIDAASEDEEGDSDAD
jgi:hypothetical protein